MHPCMNYKQAEEFLLSLTDYEKAPSVVYSATNYDLRRMELLLNRLGNPHRGRKTVHIAGTKGKGSTATMISSVLSTAGQRTGLFTSPHLQSWNERISINSRHITQKDFAHYASAVYPDVLSLNEEARHGKLTTFEALTAMAFLCFGREKADVQVLETGMGGRLDSTNIVDPDVCIITSISLDHTQVLGESLSQIASEKAGIIKRGSIAVSAPQQPEAMKVIVEKCHELNVPLITIGKEIRWRPRSSDLNGQVFSVAGNLGDYKLFIPLIGDHQMDNASLAVAALEVLKQVGLRISTPEILKGFAAVRWPARLQIMKKAPLVIIDGAHNVDSIQKILGSIRQHCTYKRAFVIFGSSADKDIAGMAKELAHFADRTVLTRSAHPRAAAPRSLADIFSAAGVKADVRKNIAEALENILSIADKQDLILVTGSLFLAADAGKNLGKLHKKRTPPPPSDFRCMSAFER